MKRRISQVLVVLLIVATILPMFRYEASAMSYSGSSSYKAGKYYRQLTNVTLTGNQRTDIVNVAKSQVGYQEGSSSSQLAGTSYGGRNYTEYGRWYGLQDMWCAMFVSWCANTAGVSTSIVPKHAYTPTGLQWFKDRGRAYSRSTVAKGNYTPQPGDIIYFKSSRNSNSTNHVGIVTKYKNGTVYTVEGNTSSATISTNGGAVCEKSYSIYNTYIVYICKPAYKNTGSNTTSGSSSTSSSTNTSSKNWLSGNAKSIVFDATYYADKYPDLKKAFGTDATKLFNHFLNYGIKEGRVASPVFDINYYINNNADLKKAFGTDKVAAMKHFASNGINEARVTAAPENLGNNFNARINYSTAGLNLSLSDNNVITYTPSEKPAQIWNFVRQSNGSYKIVNTKNGYCLEVKDGSAKNGANVQIAKDSGKAAQRWYIYKKTDGRYILRSACSSGCVVDIYNGYKESLTNVQSYTYNGTDAQQFAIKKITEVASMKPVDIGTDFYAKITASSGKNLSLSGDNVIIYGASKAPAQVWKFVRQSDGSYHIVNQKTGKLLDVAGASDISGTNVQIVAGNASDAQKWFVYEANGKYVLRPKCAPETVLDVAGGKSEDMTNVQIYEFNNTDAQKFTIKKVDYFSAVAPADIGTEFYAKISASCGKNLSLSDTNVILYTPSEKPAQKWLFQRQSDGSYKITNSKNKLVLDVNGGSSKNGANVQIYKSNDTKAQRWYVYLKEGRYVFRPVCSSSCVMDVYNGGTADLTNIQTWTFNGTAAQSFGINLVEADTSTSGNSQMAVIRKIIYAVETGGQVYGNVDYDDFTEAYTNSSAEHAITIGGGQWYGEEARTLLNLIRKTDPVTFSRLDTAGIASDLDNKNWSKYKVSKTSAKAKCIQKIISSEVGIRCQDQLIDEQMAKYMKEAEKLGVTDLAAQMMCANIRHQGGLSALKRVLKKTAKPYTLDNIYKALQSDTGNQVGAYRSRQLMVYNSLKKYIK